MRKVIELPSQSELNYLLQYNPVTGVLTWRNPPGKKLRSGQVAGNVCPMHGYRVLGLRFGGRRRLLRAHRVIWKMMTGQEPPDCIDHINCNRADNRWDNIRDGTGSINGENRRVPQKRSRDDSQCLPKGVYRHGRGFMSRRRNVYLGIFDTPEQAALAYEKAVPTESK